MLIGVIDWVLREAWNNCHGDRAVFDHLELASI